MVRRGWRHPRWSVEGMSVGGGVDDVVEKKSADAG